MGVPCPCCKRTIDDDEFPVNFLLHLPLTQIQQDIIDKLVTDYPRGSRPKQLANFVYANDPMGGPKNVINTISQHVFELKKSIRRHGWKIVSCGADGLERRAGGPTRFYRLERLER